jgi:hypothetical protein
MCSLTTLALRDFKEGGRMIRAREEESKRAREMENWKERLPPVCTQQMWKDVEGSHSGKKMRGYCLFLDITDPEIGLFLFLRLDTNEVILWDGTAIPE